MKIQTRLQKRFCPNVSCLETRLVRLRQKGPSSDQNRVMEEEAVVLDDALPLYWLRRCFSKLLGECLTSIQTFELGNSG